jgi:hypothetical protein
MHWASYEQHEEEAFIPNNAEGRLANGLVQGFILRKIRPMPTSKVQPERVKRDRRYLANCFTINHCVLLAVIRNARE